MAKQVKNKKLQPKAQKNGEKKPGVFKSFADKVQMRRLKKRQMKEDAVTRLIQRNKVNKVADSRLAVSKKKIRFDLDAADGYQFTHKGMKLADIDKLEDDFEHQDESASQMEEEYVDRHHFSGFHDQPTENTETSSHPKSKKQIYEQIIAKSKMYKYAKQRQAEQNEEKANDLDNNFEKLVEEMQFRTRDKRAYADSTKQDDFNLLMNDLKNDVMVTCDEKKQKVEEKTRRVEMKRKMKKAAQLKMMEDEEEEEDIRGWIDHNKNDDEDEEDQMDEVEDDEQEQQEENDEEDGGDQEDNQAQESNESQSDSENYQNSVDF